MPVDVISRNAVITMILSSFRELDIQGFTNQDNPVLTNRRYKVLDFTMSVSPNFITTVTLNSASDVANFRVNEVIKFFDVNDSDLDTELSKLANEQRKIREIVGTNLIFYFDSENFTGAFVSAKISSTYNIEKLNEIANTSIADFESDSGISFIPTSHHHLSLVRDLVRINCGKLAGAEKAFAKIEYKEKLQNILKYKIKGFTSLEVDTSDADDEGEFSNERFKKDLGLG